MKLLNSFLDENINISEEMYQKADNIYNKISDLLDDKLSKYNPYIFAQGSFKLRTVIRPLKGDEYDVDMVCCLNSLSENVRPSILKNLIGEIIKQEYPHNFKEKTRCWRVNYPSFHVDILPAIPERNAEMVYRLVENAKFKECPILIPEKGVDVYRSSNPLGFAKWFEEQQNKQFIRYGNSILNSGIDHLPKQNQTDTVLRSVVKIMKRHRDYMFADKKDKPISIIITTLASQCYNGEQDIIEALYNIVPQMKNYLSTNIICNPVNPQENFADKWSEEPHKRTDFLRWVTKLEKLSNGLKQEGNFSGIGFNTLMLEHFGTSSSHIHSAAQLLSTGTLRDNLPKPWSH